MPSVTEQQQEPYINYNAVTNLLRKRSQLYKERPMVHYETPDGSFKTLTFEQVSRITTRLAKKWAPEVRDVSTMAFLADHSIFYFIALIALFKLRVQVMLLSPRNSEAAHINLLNKTKASHLIVSQKYADIAHKVVQNVEQSHECKVKVLAPFNFMEILNESSPDEDLDYDFSEKDRSEVAVICQSSGTTSLPKPIYLTNEYFLYDWQLQAESVATNFPELASGPDDVLMTVFPLFHIFGIHIHFSLLLRGASAVFYERLPPSPKQLLNAITYNHVTKSALPPILLRNLVTYLKETKADINPLKQLKYIIYGGAPLPIDIGRWYHENGINVCNVYGTTEMGGKGISDFSGKDGHELWSKVRFIEPFRPYLEWEPYDKQERIYHLVIKAGCPYLARNVANREDGSYATSDLFREDVPGSGYYTILGRKDDTLVMENGEKTNPLIIEHTIAAAEAIINNCCIIAEGRQCTALLVELDPERALECTPQEMIDRVSKAVKEGNKVAPNYSTILPQMIHILPIKKKLAVTDKGSLKRKEIYQQNADVIEAMYDNFAKGSTKTNGTVNSKDLASFVINSAAESLGVDASELAQNKDKSLFDYGLNSLLATQLMNTLNQYANDLPSNFLYEYPTVDSIVKYIQGGGKNKKTTEDHYQETQEILKDYLARADKDFDKIPAKAPQVPSDGHVILLTGATGSLGSFMLRDMLQSQQVKKVYALVRQRSNESLFGRLEKAFRDRHLDTSLLQTDKLEALPMTLEKPNLGFSQEQYDALKKQVTMVQACAWLLDFNQPISHFEKECLRGLYNLLKFAYRPENPMHVHHISSVSAAGAMKLDAIPETITPQDPHVAMAMGYGQSKYIVEHLFDYLCKEKNFPCIIERMGQVCGDTLNGVWNTSEQYPLMMVGGGSQLRKMPDFGTMELDWLPVDYASVSIFEIMLETAKWQGSEVAGKVFHIVNPKTVTWIDLLEAMKLGGIQFEVIPVADWVQELKQHPENPAYRLMTFYEAAHGVLPHWETSLTTQVSDSLGKSPALNTELVSKFFNYWQSVGFYTPASA